MKVAVITGDNREHYKDYGARVPYFGTAPEALLQGFAQMPELEVHVVSCAQKPMKSPEKLAPNTWFHGLYVPKVGWMRTSYQGCVRAVRRKLKVIQPDMVHGQGTERDCAVDAVFSRFPNVLTIHGNMSELARLFQARMGTFGWLAGQLETIALARTRGVFCNSAYTEGLARPRAKKTWRVPNALREAFFAPAATDKPRNGKCVLVNVGILGERKRQVELLEMARRLHEQGVNFELQFIGEAESRTPYGARFHELLREAEAKGYARHLGLKKTDELIACFDAADGLVHFPSEEAFGLVVAEGVARGLKFFGAKLGGIQDIASDVPEAELYDAQNWDGLAAGIAKWAQAGYPRTTAGAALMRERYHPLVVAQRHLEIYREVLGSPS